MSAKYAQKWHFCQHSAEKIGKETWLWYFPPKATPARRPVSVSARSRTSEACPTVYVFAGSYLEASLALAAANLLSVSMTRSAMNAWNSPGFTNGFGSPGFLTRAFSTLSIRLTDHGWLCNITSIP